MYSASSSCNLFYAVVCYKYSPARATAMGTDHSSILFCSALVLRSILDVCFIILSSCMAQSQQRGNVQPLALVTPGASIYHYCSAQGYWALF